jgi:hypothetical protein
MASRLLRSQRLLLYTLSALFAFISVFFVFYTVRLLLVTRGLQATRPGGQGAFIGAIVFPALAVACAWVSWRCAKRARRATLLLPLDADHPVVRAILILALGASTLSLGAGFPAHAQTAARAAVVVQQEKIVTTRASGTFDVKLTPLAAYNTGDTMAARRSIDKQFHGDLEGTSKGEMLSAGTSVKGSAGYVAIERVTGTLSGRSGTFALQHSGTMTRGAPQLVITVVPDSGTGDLTGLAGTMTIDISDGKHSYVFDYTLAGKP